MSLDPQPLRRTSVDARNAREFSARHKVPAPTLEFLAALNECSRACPQLHPIQTRNCGLVVACRRWLSAGLVPSGEKALAWLVDPQGEFYRNERVLTGAVKNDPLWLQGRIGSTSEAERNGFSAQFGVPPLMFWTRPNAVVQCTDALEQILVATDLGDDLAAGLLHPPAPACYLGFGKVFQEALAPEGRWPGLDYCVPEGVYVFETTSAAKRTLAMVMVFNLPGRACRALSFFEMGIDDEAQPINASLLPEKIPDPMATASQVAMMQAVAKVFLYMSMPQSVQRQERPYSEALDKLIHRGPKKAAKLQRQLGDLYDRILLGPNEIPGHGHGEVSPHLRRGHFRMQPHGPQNSLRKLMFIAPTWVRADKLTAGDNE